jgi:two-component sensor histidine kinase
MKSGHIFKKIIYSSFFLAVFPAIFIILVIPQVRTKSRLIVEPVDKNSSVNVYEDLNSDSISEIIRPGKGIPFYFILIMDNDMHVYDQWNLPDSMNMDMSDYFFGNYDHDRYKEIYVFTYRNDSLFLNINEFFDPGGIKSTHLFITKIRVINNVITSSICPAGFYDSNGDGKDELYFAIWTGFGVDPRGVFSYDIANRKLNSSHMTGVNILYPKLVDVKGDGRRELFGKNGAGGNQKKWYPFSDWSGWLMIFNDSLEFTFPPVEFPGITSRLETEAFMNVDFRGYVVSYTTGSADTSLIEARIMFYSLAGKKIRERLYRDIGLHRDVSLVVLNNNNKCRTYLLAGNMIVELNDKLEVIRNITSPFRSHYFNYKADIDFDGENELLLYSEDDEKLIIYNANLRKLGEAKLKGTAEHFRFSRYSSQNHEKKIFLNAGGGYGYFLTLKQRDLYYLGYLVYPGIYFLFLFFIILIKRINTLQVVQKENLKQRLVTLQLQGIKSQLDPHFTFNTLNSIASLIYLEERQAAYDYMIKFTELLRGMLNDAERIYRSLGEELDFLTTYLELEKLRFGEKLKYEIEIGDGVSQKEQVPKLVLQTFAENAIKHGIMPKAEGGFLKIRIGKENDYLKLTVEDDGIGRTAAAGHSNSTGRGLKITGEFYDILNQINKKPIRHIITDLYSEKGLPTGTRVVVWIPIVI